MLVATWHILTAGEVYRDPGGDYFARHPERQTRRRFLFRSSEVPPEVRVFADSRRPDNRRAGSRDRR